MATDATGNIREALQALEGERKRIEEQIQALQRALTLMDGQGAKPAVRSARKQSVRKRRGMSLKAREAARKRMKAYWAKRKAAEAQKAKGK